MLAVLGAGAVLGLRHATDVDHLVVVTTLVQRERQVRAAVATALAWAFGHATTFLLISGAVLAFGLRPPAAFDRAIDLTIGLVLIALGAWHLLRGLGRATAAHALTPGRPWRSFAIGLLHGMAGSAAIALLALTSISSTAVAVLYLLMFTLGTTLGMTAVTLAIATPMLWVSRRRGALRALVVVAALASVGIGVSFLVAVGTA